MPDNSSYEYACNGCGTTTKRDMLVVKKVIFTTMGEGPMTARSRVVAWLCPTCTGRDEHWNLPARRQPAERVTPQPGVVDA